MLAGINDAHKTGYFKRFGLSNFPMPDAKKIHAICTAKAMFYPQSTKAATAQCLASQRLSPSQLYAA
jgi:hypothetical protein